MDSGGERERARARGKGEAHRDRKGGREAHYDVFVWRSQGVYVCERARARVYCGLTEIVH
jgi:hypothetical protein